VVSDQILQETPVAFKVFSWPEEGGKDTACSIIDGGQKNEPWSASFQPVVMATIDLDQHPHLRLTGTSAVRFWRPVFARTGDTGCLQDTANRRRAETYTLMLAKKFAQERIIAPPVLSLCELDHLLANIIRNSVGRFSPTVSVRQ
jgi:hypothetical protein